MRTFIATLFLSALFFGCGKQTPTVEDGENALSQGDFKTAATAFKAALKEHPSSVPLHYNLGVAQALAGDVSGAIASFRDVLRFTPGDLDASEALAGELRKAGSADNLSEAHELLDFVLQYREGTAAARVLNSMALVESALRRNDLALARLLTAHNADPEYAPTFYNFGNLCAKTLRLPAAAVKPLNDFLATSPADEALVKKATKMRDEAAKSLPPSYSHVTAPEAAALVTQGLEAYAKKEYAKAEGFFAQASAADPLAFDALANRANALMAMNRIAEAKTSFEAAANLDPTRFNVAYWGANITYSSGDYEKAIAALTSSIIPRWPDEPQALRLAAYSYAQGQRYYEARIYGELFLAATKRANPAAKTADFEAWMGKMPNTKFKP